MPTTSAQSPEIFRTVAESIALKVIEQKQPFQERLAQISTLKMTFFIGLGSCIISILLHLLLLYLFHYYHKLRKLMPFTHILKHKNTEETHKVQLQLTFHVPTQFHKSLNTDIFFPVACALLPHCSFPLLQSSLFIH